MAPSNSQDIKEILNILESTIHNTHNLQYHSLLRSVNPTRDDSVFTAVGAISLKKVSSDTIFGAHFHVRGKDRLGDYEYFYDGLYSYEIRHKDQKITIFDPYLYPNTPNNPAKARTALSPFVYLLIDDNISRMLMEDTVSIDLQIIDEEHLLHIMFSYKENEYGQKLERHLFIERDTYNLKRIYQNVFEMGENFTTDIELSNITRNDTAIESSIYMSESYDYYTKEFFQFPERATKSPFADLIGNKAPDFEHLSFAGQNISPKQFLGKIILLDFWETWCGYCILVMPRLNELYKKYGDDDFILIGITTENRDQVERLIRNNNLEYSNIFADPSILFDYKVVGRPVYVLINRFGYIDKITAGNLKEIEVRIDELFGY